MGSDASSNSNRVESEKEIVFYMRKDTLKIWVLIIILSGSVKLSASYRFLTLFGQEIKLIKSSNERLEIVSEQINQCYCCGA